MPHIIVKMYPGRTEDQKKNLAIVLNRATMDSLNVPDEAISISIEEVPKEAWDSTVTKIDILPKLNNVYKHRR